MHVTDKPVGQLHWMLRPLFWLQRRRYGQHLEPAKIWARVPALYLALAGFYAAIERRRSPIDAALRSLVQIRVSQINHCAFCIDLNASLSAQRSGSLDKALAVDHWRESEAFDTRERLVFEYAEAITLTDGQVTDALIAGLRQHFDEAALIELTALVAFQNLSSKFNAALDIPAQGFCRMPLS
jgi:AhpD family alkylhydroperoxidase